MNKMIKQTLELTTEFQKEVVSRLDAEIAKATTTVQAVEDNNDSLIFISEDLDGLSNIFMDVMKDVIEDFNRGEL